MLQELKKTEEEINSLEFLISEIRNRNEVMDAVTRLGRYCPQLQDDEIAIDSLTRYQSEIAEERKRLVDAVKRLGGYCPQLLTEIVHIAKEINPFLDKTKPKNIGKMVQFVSEKASALFQFICCNNKLWEDLKTIATYLKKKPKNN